MATINFYKIDYLIALGLILLAFLIRIPNLSYPAEPVFDEVHYSNFAIRTLKGEGIIDLHPPLARLMFAGVLKIFSYDDLSREIKEKENFGNFPYFPLRFLSVLAGSFLAGIVFLIAKKIYGNNLLAALSGFLIVFDGALIAYSRLILPDIHILFFGFLGILLLQLSVDAKNSLIKVLFFILAGFSIGASASIKWSGLGFLAAGIIFIFFQKKFKYLLPLVLLVLLAYILFFSFLFSPELFAKYTFGMFRGHLALQDHPAASPPYKWLFADDSFTLWGSGREAIRLEPNLLSWTAVFVSLVVSFFLLSKEGSPRLFFLAGSFLANYLPFFLIPRALFIYHYFPALIFGYLLVPKTIELFSKIFKPKKINHPIYIFAGLVVLFFLIFIPFIY